MKDYFRNDITISLDFGKHKEILKERFGTDLSVSTYDSRLIYNQRKPEYLQLTIYYQHTDYLFEKFKILKENGICIFQTIKPKPIENKWEFPDVLDFSDSKLIDIEDSHYWEHNKKPVILIIDNLNILVNGRYFRDGRFQLTENIHQHLDEYVHYGLLGRHRYDDKFIEEDKNRETNFGDISFVLSFEHWFGNSTKFNLNIIRDAYLTITDNSEKITDVELIKYGNSLCLLMSFYWQKTIDYFNARVRINNIDNYRTRKILKYSDYFIDESQDYLLKKQFETFYDFVQIINYEKFNKNYNLINELVPRIIKTKNVDDISAFMILYNVIEKIRNHCLTNPVNSKELSIKEEFSFIKSKNATNKFIKNKIKEIKEIVEKTDIEEFVSKASDKVSFIKKTGLIDQFDSLIVYLDLKPENYDIDFKKLIKIRNNIYHGKLPTEDVIPYNEQMMILVYDMIIKLMAD